MHAWMYYGHSNKSGCVRSPGVHKWGFNIVFSLSIVRIALGLHKKPSVPSILAWTYTHIYTLADEIIEQVLSNPSGIATIQTWSILDYRKHFSWQ